MNIIDFIPIGQKNAIGTDALKAASGCDTRTIRQMIATARTSGAVICSSLNGSRGGYFRPSTPEEARHYVNTERCRIQSAQEALKSAEQYMQGGGAN